MTEQVTTTPTPAATTTAPEASPPPASAPPVAGSPPAAAAPVDAPAAPGDAPKPEGEAPSLLGEKTAFPFTADKLEIPEGMTFADEAKGEFAQWATKHGISHDAAQEILSWGSSFVKKGAEAAASSQVQTWKDTNAAWVKEVLADPEIGGDKFDAVVRPSVSRLIDNFGPEQGAAIRKMLDDTGTGNHPAMVRFLYGLSKQLTEGGPVTGDAIKKSNNALTPAQIMYPSHSQTRQ